ncbi:MAG: winged helix-turn-helix domain-containing protein [Candidatus Bathyarchaeia archaeon]|jgi:predicted transcriptional regulator
MGKNRDSLSIVADILEGTGSGASKTRIMFAANLSFKLLEKYLDLVLQAGLITVESRKYQLTEQGQRFLKQYRPFRDRYMAAQSLLACLDNERQRLSFAYVNQKNIQGIGSIE